MMNVVVFNLIETYVPEGERKSVATAVLRSQDIHEMSWDSKEKRYMKSIAASSMQAAKENGLNSFWNHVIHNLNVTCWNDVQDWSKEVLKNTRK